MKRLKFSAEPNPGTARLEESIAIAVREWVESLLEGFNTVTAAVEDFEASLRTSIGPSIGVEYIATAAAHAPSGGEEATAALVPWPEAVAGVATVQELLDEYPTTFSGVDASQVTHVILSPGWKRGFQKYLTEAVNLVVGMEDTTFKKMASILSDEKLGTPFEQHKRVREFLSWDEEGGYEGWMRRAERIARTELHTARNAAVNQAAALTHADGTPMVKMWNAVHDSRTRHAHLAADGQKRPMSEPFEVDGEALMYPGDRERGRASNTIQCRCTCTYIEEEFADELDWISDINSLEDIEKELGMGHIAAAGNAPADALEWEGQLAPLGEPTGDGRVFATEGKFRFREFPLPLLWQESTGPGHDASRVVGTIDSGEVTEAGLIAKGTVFADEEKVLSLLKKGVVRPSVDLCDMEAETLDTDKAELLTVNSATVMAATLVPMPAFENVGIALTGESTTVDAGALVASAGAVVDLGEYNREFFENPGLDAPTPVTVTPEGRVFGHLALWDSCHVGQPGRCVEPPRSGSHYAAFHQSTVHDENGSPLAVGRLTVGGGHAGGRAGVRAAAEHYDTTGACWAFVRAGEDEHGIYVAGQVNVDATPEKVREGASAPLSGDWRRVGGGMELVAALSVSTPGFPVRREFVVAGESMSLVAAADIPAPAAVPAEELKQVVLEAMREYAAENKTAADDGEDSSRGGAPRDLVQRGRAAARVFAEADREDKAARLAKADKMFSDAEGGE